MSFDQDINFIINSIMSPENMWCNHTQNELSHMSFPDSFLGPRRDLLKGDMYREWGRWFIEQFIDERYLTNGTSYVEMLRDVYTIVNSIVGWTYDEKSRKEIAGIISKYVMKRVNFCVSDNTKRRKLTKLDKHDLLYFLGSSPRCWMTGLLFQETAIDIFLGDREAKIKLPSFVDKYMPIGINERHLMIEVDHLYPFTLGGSDDLDNYRLICGWANIIKSSQTSIYSRGTLFTREISTYLNVNNYYWALRTIGLKRKCECADCNKTLENSQLTISSFHGQGKLVNPISMKVFCYDHADKGNRFISREKFSL